MWHVPLPKIEPRPYGKEAEDDAKIKDGEMKCLKAKGREVRDAAWGADDNNHHLYVWSSQQLANLFRVAGYEVVDKKVLADGAWRSGGAEAFWAAAERENRHPQTKVVAWRPAALGYTPFKKKENLNSVRNARYPWCDSCESKTIQHTLCECKAFVKNIVSSLSYLANFVRTQKQLLSISAAAALPRNPKADRAAPGVLYTYIDTHARSGVGIAVHTRLQTPFRAFKLPIPNATYGCVVGRQLELQVDSERLAA
jgi:hypothetical protein